MFDPDTITRGCMLATNQKLSIGYKFKSELSIKSNPKLGIQNTQHPPMRSIVKKRRVYFPTSLSSLKRNLCHDLIIKFSINKIN